MTTISKTPATTPPVAAPSALGRAQRAVADFVRAAGAGYNAVSKQSAVEVDKAAIHPFEAVSTVTGVIKDKTANIKGVNRATNILHTIGAFGMLVLTANVSGTVRAPGETASDIANHIADAIDGRKTANGWGIGWGLRSAADKPASGDDTFVAQSALGAALAQAGMR